MFKKIFKFLCGYVIIEVTGKNKERFLNMCLANRLEIWNLVYADNHIHINITRRDFFEIRRLARKSGVRVRILSKHGGREIIKKYRHRYMLVLAVTGMAVYFILVPQYIWCVEIDGLKNGDFENAEKILRDMGVYVGARKSKIADLGDIKDAIVFGDEEINWAWLYLDGAKAKLLVQERTAPPEIRDKNTPTDIISAWDGYVRKATVKRGERNVRKGQTVTKGQVLVSGKVAVYSEGYPEKYSYVRSIGEVIADTVRTEDGFFSETETLRIRTGNRKVRVSVEFLGKRYDLFGKPEDAFEKCDVETVNYDVRLPVIGYVGLGISIHNAYEVNEVINTLDETEVLARGRDKLEERICKKLGIGAVKISDQLTYRKENEKYYIRLKMQLRENIGIEIPVKE